MKKIYLLIIILLGIGVNTSIAQRLNVKKQLIDKNYYPLNNAKVTVKGTGIKTETDKNGFFEIDGVPFKLDTLIVEKNNKTYYSVLPVTIKMKKELIKQFTWFVKLGGGVPFLSATASSNSYEMYMGGGVDMRINRHWSFQPGINLVYRNMNDHSYYNGNYYDEYKIGTMEIPLLFALRFPVGNYTNMVIRLGGYMDIGLWGEVTNHSEKYNNENNNHEMTSEKFKLFPNHRITGGGAYGISFETGNHLVFGIIGHSGLTSYHHSEFFTSASLEIGYRF